MVPMLIQELSDRKKELLGFIKTCRQRLSHLPPGFLRISESRGKKFYYLKQSEKDRNGKYISKKNTKIIKQLAEKEYYLKALIRAEEELKIVDHLLSFEKQPSAHSLLDPSIRDMVIPLEESVENAIKRWESIPDNPMESRVGSYIIKTKRGDYVRSKAEYNIANMLFDEEIPYKYEAEFMTVDGTYQRPDFTVMNPSTGKLFRWEHFGMMDKPEYVKKMINKLDLYRMSGLFPGNGLIITFDDGSHPLDTYFIRDIIDKFLK